MRFIIGIDPGAGGGVGVYDGLQYMRVIKMPATEDDLVSFFKRAAEHNPNIFMEKVHAMPGNGVVSMFSFGQQVGTIKTALAAAGLLDRTQFITPQEWQRAIGCLTKGDKKVSKKAAETMFPNLTITHATADALLITEYGRRVVSGEITRHETPTVARTSRRAKKGKPQDRKTRASKQARRVGRGRTLVSNKSELKSGTKAA